MLGNFLEHTRWCINVDTQFEVAKFKQIMSRGSDASLALYKFHYIVNC